MIVYCLRLASNCAKARKNAVSPGIVSNADTAEFVKSFASWRHFSSPSNFTKVLFSFCGTVYRLLLLWEEKGIYVCTGQAGDGYIWEVLLWGKVRDSCIPKVRCHRIHHIGQDFLPRHSVWNLLQTGRKDGSWNKVVGQMKPVDITVLVANYIRIRNEGTDFFEPAFQYIQFFKERGFFGHIPIGWWK